MANQDREKLIIRAGRAAPQYHRPIFDRSLSQELHHRFDVVAAERIPPSLAALLDRLEPNAKNDFRR